MELPATVLRPKRVGEGRRRITRYLASFALASTCTALLLVSPAWGDRQTVLDRDDSPGPFDIVAARHFHRITDSGKTRLGFRFVTYESWTDDDFDIASVELNFDRDSVPERCVVFRRWQVEPGVYEWVAEVFRECSYFIDEKLGETRRVTRPDDHSLAVTFGKSLLRKNVSTYKWRVVTGFSAEGNADCPPPPPPPPGEPGPDGTYWGCRDVTRWTTHTLR